MTETNTQSIEDLRAELQAAKQHERALAVEAAARCINRFAEKGLYEVSAALLRRGGAPEGEIYERVMWWAEERGDDPAAVFELVWGLPALIE